jgi:hypothetical protein
MSMKQTASSLRDSTALRYVGTFLPDTTSKQSATTAQVNLKTTKVYTTFSAEFVPDSWYNG